MELTLSHRYLHVEFRWKINAATFSTGKPRFGEAQNFVDRQINVHADVALIRDVSNVATLLS